MALTLFQIGNLVIPENRTSVTQSYSNKMRGKTSDSLSSPNMYTRNTRFMYSERQLSVEVYLTDGTVMTGEEFEQTARSYVGIQLPVIAFDAPFKPYEQFNKNSGCNGCDNKECCLLFLQCIGVINSVSDAEEDDWASPRMVTLDITLMSFWRGLDTTFWQYDDFGFNEKNRPTSDTTYEFFDVPDCGEFLGDTEKETKSFLPKTYTDYLFLFSADYLNDSIYRSTSCYSGACKNTKFATGEVYAKKNVIHRVPVDVKSWGAPPMPIVVLEFINGDNEILIKNSWQEAGIYNVSRTTRVDIASTNAVLLDNNLAELDLNDKIVLGDFTYTNSSGQVFRNAVIIRDGEVLSVQPSVEYPDFFPCMITPSNSSTIMCYGDCGVFSFAYYYRRI